MKNIQDRIKNAGLLSGVSFKQKDNTPRELSKRRRPYYAQVTDSFIQEYVKYASDFFEAKVQGLDQNDFEMWTPVRIRLADVVNENATSTRKADDIKSVLFEDKRITYLRPGTKIEAAGSVWLVTNPQNISGTVANAIVERCNAVWNHMDWYGNIHSEPIVVKNSVAKAATSDPQDTMLLTKGYFNIICQNNRYTKQLNNNSRMILGSGAYQLTAFTDFLQEFTGDYDTVRLLEFEARYDEPNTETDDMERHIAGGKNFMWEIFVEGVPTLGVNETTRLTAKSKRCGVNVTPTYEHPIYYAWESSDESVATVDTFGNVTAVGEGVCEIYATLEENEEWFGAFVLTVAGEQSGETIGFVKTPPEILRAFEKVTLEAAVFENGILTDNVVSWNIDGADQSAYSVTVTGNEITIECWAGSVEPLSVTAEFNGKSTEAIIDLEGI